MAQMTPREVLQHVRSTAGADGLKDLPPIAVAVAMAPGVSPDDPDAWYTRSMLIGPTVHPTLAALMDYHGATRRGRATWQIGFGDDTPKEAFVHLLDSAASGTVWWKGDLETRRGSRDLAGRHTTPAYTHQWQVRARALRGMGHWLTPERIQRLIYNRYRTGDMGAAQYGVITLNVAAVSLFISVHTTQFLQLPTDLATELGLPPGILHQWEVGRGYRDPVQVFPAEALAIAEWAAGNGLTVVDPDASGGLVKFARLAKRSVVAWPRPGRPAQATVSIGANVPAQVRERFTKDLRPRAGRTAVVGQTDSVTLAQALQDLPADTHVVHPAVLDTARMASVPPVDDPRLRDFQKEAVARHEVTRFGYVNAVSPGMGKTVMTLVSMARKATRTPGYRGLVVAEANVRAQWCAEAARWFPAACVVRVESRSDAAELAQTLAEAGPFPVLVVTSYSLASDVADHLDDATDGDSPVLPEPGDEVTQTPATAAEPPKPKPQPQPAPSDGPLDLLDLLSEILDAEPEPAPAGSTEEEAHEEAVSLVEALLSVHWHDLVADEAVVLGVSTSTKQSKALWRLRQNAQVAVALTGTPIKKSINDLGALVAWVRGDRRMFYGRSLDTQFDLSNDDDLRDFLEAMGPILFRRDKSEIDDELPGVESQVMLLQPSPAEKALAHAARNELKRAYDELLTWLTVVAERNEGSEEHQRAKEALEAARHAWLGGTTLARMAASDPAALVTAKGAGAALLASQGLIAAATQTTGTKRAAVVADVVERVARGERVLIFTEFATVARGLVADLDAAGLRVGEVLGGGGRRRDRFVEQFQNGALDVLVATSAGERGLNLQAATTVVHYDLPWTPQSIIQRMGRAERMGSTNSLLKVVFPVMADTIEERVSSVVVARAATMMRALDTSRGVDARGTDTGRALGLLASAARDDEVSTKEAALLQITRELLAA